VERLSLARFWRHCGRQNEARVLLGYVYGWFSEGFETGDLQTARPSWTSSVNERDVFVEDIRNTVRVGRAQRSSAPETSLSPSSCRPVWLVECR
jgi:hypothetical protein